MLGTSWIDVLAPLGTLVDGDAVLISPIAHNRFLGSTVDYDAHTCAIVRSDGSLLLVSRGTSPTDDGGDGDALVHDEEEHDANAARFYAIVGVVAAGAWCWRDPAKREAAKLDDTPPPA